MGSQNDFDTAWWLLETPTPQPGGYLEHGSVTKPKPTPKGTASRVATLRSHLPALWLRVGRGGHLADRRVPQHFRLGLKSFLLFFYSLFLSLLMFLFFLFLFILLFLHLFLFGGPTPMGRTTGKPEKAREHPEPHLIDKVTIPGRKFEIFTS